MADDKTKGKDKGKEPDKKDVAPARTDSFLKTLITAVVVMVIAMTGAFLIFWFIFYPALDGKHAKGEKNAAEEAGDSARGDKGKGENEKIPPTAVTVTFDDGFANVLMPEPSMPALLLMYQVSFLVSDPETAELVNKNKPIFEDIITTLHSYRSREELNDPMVKTSIQKQILEMSNEKLRQLIHKPGPEKRILSVLHIRFAVHE